MRFAPGVPGHQLDVPQPFEHGEVARVILVEQGREHRELRGLQADLGEVRVVDLRHGA